MTFSKIIKHRSELMETVQLFRRLGANWFESFVHASACILLIA